MAAPAVQADISFFSLCHCATEKLEVDWPLPPLAQNTSLFIGFFLLHEPMTIKNCLPMFPDFLSEFTSSWNKPLSTHVTVPAYGQYMDLEGAEKAGLGGPPPMDLSLAANLALSHNQGVGGAPTLPSKHCRFSSSQLNKSYCAQAGAAHVLS